MTFHHFITALLCSFLWIGVSAAPFSLIAQEIEQDPPDTSFTPDWDWSAEQFVANEIMYTFGGKKNWKDKSWNLAFDVVTVANGQEVQRHSYQWNRSTNQCIAGGKTPDGRPWQVNFTNVAAHTGTATVAGKPVLKRELPEILAMTANHFNDHLRGMLLPFFLLDSGVVLVMGPDTMLLDESQYPKGLDGEMIRGGSGLQGGAQGQMSTLIAEFTQDSTKPIYTIFLDSGREVKAVEAEQGGQKRFLWWDKVKRFGDIRLRLATRRQDFDHTLTIQYENIKVGKFEVKVEQ